MASIKKSRKNTMILILAIAIIIAVILAVTQMNRTLKLNGLQETVINIGCEYEDEGRGGIGRGRYGKDRRLHGDVHL